MDRCQRSGRRSANFNFRISTLTRKAPLLREALAKHTNVPTENLLAGAGSDELIDLLMRLLLEPGDRILICPPTFGMYAFGASLNAAQVLQVPRRSDFAVDLLGIQQAVQEHRPKLLFFDLSQQPRWKLNHGEGI